MPTQTRRLFVAKSSFSVDHKGANRMVSPRDEPVTDEDPIYKQVPHMYREWQPVEQATASPGEQRKR